MCVCVLQKLRQLVGDENNLHDEIFSPPCRHVLARGLPQVQLLRLQARGGGQLALHQGERHPLQEGLHEVIVVVLAREGFKKIHQQDVGSWLYIVDVLVVLC